ncbi:MAG: hypothetical protein QM754_14080 [Tepidisphaeraceae bacterium]
MAERIRFGRIAEIVERSWIGIDLIAEPTLDELLAADTWSRGIACDLLAAGSDKSFGDLGNLERRSGLACEAIVVRKASQARPLNGAKSGKRGHSCNAD